MKTNTTIIGYKLIKPMYKPAVLSIIKSEGSIYPKDDIFLIGGWLNAINSLKNAEVIDIWFEPVCQFKKGDYVFVLKDVDSKHEGCNDSFRQGQIFKVEIIEDFYNLDYWLVPENKNRGLISKYCRLATPEEIKAAQTKELQLGDKLIKITISKNRIVAENKVVGIEAIKALYDYLTTAFEIPKLPWSCNFIDGVKIGCSTFSKKDLDLIIKTYEEVNN